MKFLAALWLLLLPALSAAQPRPFCIRVEASDTGAPIAGARLETIGRVLISTDVNGNAAFYEPGLMDQDVFFYAKHASFEHAADGFGFRGRALRTVQGGQGTLVMTRTGATTPGRTDDEETRLCARAVPGPAERFTFRVIDAETGRGVPLVRVGKQWTDSNGLIAFYERPAMGVPAWFEIFSHGHAFPDGGALITPLAGESIELRLPRRNVAERAYRVTGGGIYADTVLLGGDGGVLNAGVLGQDSVLSVVYRGEPFFVWGDTNKVSYPLGSFDSPGARGSPRALRYFENDAGFVRGLAPIPGPGQPVWLEGLAVVHGDGGDELWATYAKVKSLGENAHVGLVKWNAALETFEVRLRFSDGGTPPLAGHPFEWQHDDGPWLEYRYGARVRATPQALLDTSSYLLLRDAGTLFNRGVDVETGNEVRLHENDTVAWNPWRERFVRLTTRVGGDTSFLGDVYYQEGDTPRGPFVYAREVLEHDRYSFYNPRHHPFLDEDGGRVIWFEGTYADTFSGAAEPTPRYDYNQVMYRLALDDPRMLLPVPVYARLTGQHATKRDLPPGVEPLAVVFWAYDREAPGLVPVGRAGGPCSGSRLMVHPPGPALFWALPPLSDSGVPFLDGTCRVFPATSSDVFPLDDYSAPLKAWAGDDRCITQRTPDGGYVVQLSAGGSRARGSRRVKHTWSGVFGTVESESFTAVLPAGLHQALLTVETEDGGRASDSVLIEAREAPIIEAPPEGCRCDGGGALLALAATALLARSRRCTVTAEPRSA